MEERKTELHDCFTAEQLEGSEKLSTGWCPDVVEQQRTCTCDNLDLAYLPSGWQVRMEDSKGDRRDRIEYRPSSADLSSMKQHVSSLPRKKAFNLKVLKEIAITDPNDVHRMNYNEVPAELAERLQKTRDEVLLAFPGIAMQRRELDRLRGTRSDN